MNGFRRASRKQAAIVGLAVLMGASFLGCHSGPRLFSKKDRDERATKKELAEKDNDKSKFVNRKKVRPESDYRDGADERVAKSDSKPKSKSSDAARKSANDSVERAAASRQRPDDAKDSKSRSSKAVASQSKTLKPVERPEVARRDTDKRSVADLLNDDTLFNDKLPETRPTAKESASAKRSVVAKSKSLDENPFKNSVIGPQNGKQPEKTVANVNFLDEDDLDDELEEEAEEFENPRAPVANKTVAKTPVAANSINRRVPPSAAPSSRKFLDEADIAEPADGSFQSMLRDESPERLSGETVAPPIARAAKRTADSANTVAGQKLIDRGQQVQQTLNDWRREMDRDESRVGVTENVDVVPSAPSSPPQQRSATKGHISQTSIEEFTASMKSEGAVLNGELIIDTNSLPSRFQRTTSNPNEPTRPQGTSGRVNSNSGVSIDIVPGATQTRSRPAGQISLQSASEETAESELTTAGFEQTSDAADLGKLPSLKLDENSDSGPKLSPLDDESRIAPAPPEELPSSSAGISLTEGSSKSRLWKRTLLVFAAMASAVVIGFGLRRRMELLPEPIRVPKQPQPNDPQDPGSWPRG